LQLVVGVRTGSGTEDAVRPGPEKNTPEQWPVPGLAMPSLSDTRQGRGHPGESRSGGGAGGGRADVLPSARRLDQKMFG
jgi:hypothetical protein